MDVQDMFKKPEIPVEVRIPNDLMGLLISHGITASRTLKLGVYALLCAENAREINIEDMLNEVHRSKMPERRVTIRVPVHVYDELLARVPNLSVSETFSRIALLYEQNPEVLNHV